MSYTAYIYQHYVILTGHSPVATILILEQRKNGLLTKQEIPESTIVTIFYMMIIHKQGAGYVRTELPVVGVVYNTLLFLAEAIRICETAT